MPTMYIHMKWHIMKQPENKISQKQLHSLFTLPKKGWLKNSSQL